MNDGRLGPSGKEREVGPEFQGGKYSLARRSWYRAAKGRAVMVGCPVVFASNRSPPPRCARDGDAHG